MEKILHLKRNTPSIGLLVRKRSAGPERNLIRRFIHQVGNEYGNKSRCLAIFQEPWLAFGYPDVVLVEFDRRTYKRWTPQRSHLGQDDLKVLHYVFLSNGATSIDVENRLGLSERRVRRTIEALLDARMIRRYAKGWRALSLEAIFAVHKIIAVEAKINDMQSAFQQAWANTWFASESYVLTGSQGRPSEVFNDKGIGIYLMNDERIERVLRAKKHHLPQSYAAWLFNEWVGRHMYLKTSA